MTRAQQVIKRLAEIEQEARRDEKWRNGQHKELKPAACWQTDPLAVEHRQLMCEWWTLPNNDVMEALYGNRFEWDTWGNLPKIEKRLLTSKGTI